MREATDAEVVVPPAEPGAAVRPPRPRPNEREACAPVDGVLVAESSPAGESPGAAHADAAPLVVIATPIPSAIANPPTRPTQADARIPKKPSPSDGRRRSALYLKERPENATRSDYQMLSPSPRQRNYHTTFRVGEPCSQNVLSVFFAGQHACRNRQRFTTNSKSIA